MSELRERAARRIPGGVNSNVRLDAPNTFFARGEGPRIYDVEGRDYIDYLLGQGPAFLGHAHPAVVSAVSAGDRDRHGLRARRTRSRSRPPSSSARRSAGPTWCAST